MGDLDGDGAPELAVLSRRGDQHRVTVVDALTGRAQATLRLERGMPVFDLEPLPPGETTGVAILTQSPVDYRRWEALILEVPGGAELGRLDFSTDDEKYQEPVDLEVLTVDGETAVAALIHLTYTRSVRLRARELTGGAVLADWQYEGLVPEDLEVFEPDGDEAPRLAILAGKERPRSVRALVSPFSSPPSRKLRFGKRYLARDLATSGAGRNGLVSILLEEGDVTRVTTRRAGNGRRFSRVDFPGVSEAADLTVLPFPGSSRGVVAVVGKGACAGGRFALVVRDLRNGSLVSCTPLAAD